MLTDGRNPRPATAQDPRVLRSRARLLEAGERLFLAQGYVDTTMEEIASAAGLSRKTIYNNFPDKEALFHEIVAGVTDYAGRFVRELEDEFPESIPRRELAATLDRIAIRLVQAVLRQQVINLRRLLISEASRFPALAARYLEQAPGRVIDVFESRLSALAGAGLLQIHNARVAAGQLAYLIVGEALDRSVLLGSAPSAVELEVTAREAVATFLARYGAPDTRNR